MRGRYVLLAASIAWLSLGALGGLVTHGMDTPVSEVAIILPAVPLYFVSSLFSTRASHGVPWDSAHSLPFLNGLGLVVMYAAPALAGLFVALKRR